MIVMGLEEQCGSGLCNTVSQNGRCRCWYIVRLTQQDWTAFDSNRLSSNLHHLHSHDLQSSSRLPHVVVTSLSCSRSSFLLCHTLIIFPTVVS